MALIEKRGEHQWRARVRKLGFPDQSRTFNHRKDAERWAKETELRIERGEFISTDSQRTTFDEVATRYRREVTPSKRSAKSEGFRIDLLLEHFGPYFLAAIRPLDVASFRDHRLKTVAAQTVIHDLNTLSAILEHSRKEWGIHLPENPVKLVRKPIRPKSRDRRVSPEELDWLMRAADAGRVDGMREVITLAVETSCRLGELLSFEWKHINFKQRTAHLCDTKNGESRTIALSSTAIAVLESMPRHIHGRVFHWARADSFEKTWQRCVNRAHKLYAEHCESRNEDIDSALLQDLRFHDLRHEATSRLFEKGLNPFEVSSMTGHKSMQMLKRYTHVEASKLAAKLG